MDDRLFDSREFDDAGAVYVFRRNVALYSGTGVLLEPQSWAPMEQMKLVAPDFFARDSFGTSVAIAGSTLFVGATGDDGVGAWLLQVSGFREWGRGRTCQHACLHLRKEKIPPVTSCSFFFCQVS